MFYLLVCPSQLAQDGMVNQSDARLLHELGERVRTLLDSYFRSPPGLAFSFTHLVCRTAITGIAPPTPPPLEDSTGIIMFMMIIIMMVTVIIF